MRTPRALRTYLRLSVIATPVFIAACLGGRGTKRPGPALPPPPATLPDSTKPAVTVPVIADSIKAPDPDSLLKVVDSLKKSIPTDSEKLAALKPGAKKTPPKKKATKECLLDTQDSPPEARFVYQQQNDSTSNLIAGGGFVGHCTGEKNTLKADSAEYFQTTGFVSLYGNVTYEEKGEFVVTANHATYFLKDGKLYAEGNVNARQLKSGSVFVGPMIEYYRVMPDIRETSRLYAPNSPTVQILQKDSSGKDLPPVRVTSSVMEDTGDSVLVAWGSVSIVRTDITGRSDSASFNKPTGNARLIRLANIVSTTKEQPFTLSGDTIDLFTHDQILDRVMAKHGSKATSGEVNMSAERLDMRLIDRKIDRAYMYGPGRAKALTKKQTLEADSMDIQLPNQRIRELRAFGRAIAISKPDTAKMFSEENDILKGDSLLAEFDSLKNPADTSAKAELKRIVSMGNASSFVQIASRSGKQFPPAMNYIRGKRLVVRFDSGSVREIAVDSSASGRYYEPVIDTTGDSTSKTKPRKPPPLAAAENARSAPDFPSRRSAPPATRASAAILPTRMHRTR